VINKYCALTRVVSFSTEGYLDIRLKVKKPIFVISIVKIIFTLVAATNSATFVKP
jgi:hypothetical protein